MSARTTPLLRGLAVLLALGGLGALAPADAAPAPGGRRRTPRPSPARPTYVPPIRHVFVINIENKGYDETWGDAEPGAVPRQARCAPRACCSTPTTATAHNSQPNYVAQISGQAPNPQMQADCQMFSAFTSTGPDAGPGQAVGSGCVYPDERADACRAS